MGIAETSHNRLRRSCAAILSALGLAGCAIHPAPVQQLADAREAIASAALAGAKAPSSEEFGRAREKLALAQRLLNARKNEPATWLAEQAQVDAELAAAKLATIQAQRALLLARRAAPAVIRTAHSD
jgi:hypothetical protein